MIRSGTESSNAIEIVLTLLLTRKAPASNWSVPPKARTDNRARKPSTCTFMRILSFLLRLLLITLPTWIVMLHGHDTSTHSSNVCYARFPKLGMYGRSKSSCRCKFVVRNKSSKSQYHSYHVGEQLDALITWWMFYAFKIPNTICTNWTAWRLTISPHGFESDQRHVVLPWAPTRWKLLLSCQCP